MPKIALHPDGLVLSIRVQPGARKNSIQGVHDGALKVSVQAAPEDGKANDAIMELLKKSLGIKRNQIEMLSGQTSRNKKILIRELKLEELEQKIRAQSAQMIEPDRMGDLLKRLLAERPGVTLVGMKTIPQQLINLGTGGAEAVAPPAPPAAHRTAAGTKPAEAVGPQQVALYRNGMQLVLRGGFLDLLGYLRELEKLPVKIYWDKLDLTVLDYPVSQMTLVVNTIGLDPAWMKI